MLLALCGCSARIPGNSEQGATVGGAGKASSSGSGGVPAVTGAPAVGGAATPGSGGSPATSTVSSSGGVGQAAAGAPSLTGASAGGAPGSIVASAGAGGLPVVGASGAAGAGGASHTVDHCLYGYDPEPTDDTMAYGPYDFLPPGVTDQSQVDTIVQPEVLAWFHAHNWEDVHVEWHAIRTCNTSAKGQGTLIDICQYKQLIPQDQNCQTGGDGYQFLLAHRHMIQILSQLWPKHAADFAGFPKFPQSAADVPPEWQAAWKPWSSTTLANGIMGDDIDQPENLAKFPDQGALGFWLQCLAGQMLPNRSDAIASGGIHFDLHAQWVRTQNTTHGLNNGNANVDNYMFYKIHGWIDGVWARYRKAKGLSDDDPQFKADLLAQCREMDTEEQLSIQTLGAQGDSGTVDTTPLPVESGFFHEQVRPIFEDANNKCSGCHSETGAAASLSLGGHISSLDIVNGLVNQPAIDGGQFKLVVPGDPDHSWLYLKAAGLAGNAGCTAASDGSSLCITAVMPPNGSGATTVTAEELATIKQWISDGAQPPTEVSAGL
ncbi:MAG TPA: hypothetical protein VMI54_16770 [Polyangiaceae bacterium]|nr:hypothetical protein [Polyangiaceae bacterium]